VTPVLLNKFRLRFFSCKLLGQIQTLVCAGSPLIEFHWFQSPAPRRAPLYPHGDSGTSYMEIHEKLGGRSPVLNSVFLCHLDLKLTLYVCPESPKVIRKLILSALNSSWGER
jgi:hypothetical protein